MFTDLPQVDQAVALALEVTWCDYKPVGKTMTKTSLVGTLGSLMRVALLIQLYLREAYTLIGQPRWRAPV